MRHCEVTGNLCGTDTRLEGHPCGCGECVAWVSERTAPTPEEAWLTVLSDGSVVDCKLNTTEAEWSAGHYSGKPIHYRRGDVLSERERRLAETAKRLLDALNDFGIDDVDAERAALRAALEQP